MSSTVIHDVGGALVVPQWISISGFVNSNLNVSGALNASGAATFYAQVDAVQSMNVSGALSVSGATTLEGSLNVTGTPTFSSTIEVVDGANVSGALSVSGFSTFESTLTAKSTLDVSGVLSVSGTPTFSSTIEAVAGANVSGALSVSGLSTFESTLTAKSTLDVSGVLSVSGTSTFSSTIEVVDGANISGPLSVSGSSTFENTLTANSNLDVSGALTVSGTPTFSSTIEAVAGANVGGALSVSGTSTLYGAVTAEDILSVSGDLTVSGTSILTGTMTAQSTVDVLGDLTVSGATSLNSLSVANNATFGGSLLVSGDLTVDGTTTFINTQIVEITDAIIEMNSYPVISVPDAGISMFYYPVNREIKFFEDSTRTVVSGDATTITFNAGDVGSTDLSGYWVSITDNSGYGETRPITAYNSGTQQATVSGWGSEPAAGSLYQLFTAPYEVVVATASGSTLQFPGTVSGAGLENYYRGYFLAVAGTVSGDDNVGQLRRINEYTTSNVAVLSSALTQGNSYTVLAYQPYTSTMTYHNVSGTSEFVFQLPRTTVSGSTATISGEKAIVRVGTLIAENSITTQDLTVTGNLTAAGLTISGSTSIDAVVSSSTSGTPAAGLFTTYVFNTRTSDNVGTRSLLILDTLSGYSYTIRADVACVSSSGVGGSFTFTVRAQTISGIVETTLASKTSIKPADGGLIQNSDVTIATDGARQVLVNVQGGDVGLVDWCGTFQVTRQQTPF
jgi:hypothetical protein